jgi:hypothetical protein
LPCRRRVRPIHGELEAGRTGVENQEGGVHVGTGRKQKNETSS